MFRTRTNSKIYEHYTKIQKQLDSLGHRIWTATGKVLKIVQGRKR